jgi:hypothetical protein
MRQGAFAQRFMRAKINQNTGGEEIAAEGLVLCIRADPDALSQSSQSRRKLRARSPPPSLSDNYF